MAATTFEVGALFTITATEAQTTLGRLGEMFGTHRDR